MLCKCPDIAAVHAPTTDAYSVSSQELIVGSEAANLTFVLALLVAVALAVRTCASFFVVPDEPPFPLSPGFGFPVAAPAGTAPGAASDLFLSGMPCCQPVVRHVLLLHILGTEYDTNTYRSLDIQAGVCCVFDRQGNPRVQQRLCQYL